MHHSAKFFKIGPTDAEILVFLFLTMATVTDGTQRAQRNFVRISRSVVEILQFFEFLTWPSPPS